MCYEKGIRKLEKHRKIDRASPSCLLKLDYKIAHHAYEEVSFV